MREKLKNLFQATMVPKLSRPAQGWVKEYLRDRDTKIICEKLLKTFTNCRHSRSKMCENAYFLAQHQNQLSESF